MPEYFLYGLEESEKIAHSQNPFAEMVCKIGSIAKEFGSTPNALNLLERVQGLGFATRMRDLEASGKHNLLSHSLFASAHAFSVGGQLNEIYRGKVGGNVVDIPIAATSALLHDIGKVITSEEIYSFGLNAIDISKYKNPFPPDARLTTIETNDILRTVALLVSFGPQYSPFADAAAHSIYHLIFDEPVPIERLLVILSDFSTASNQQRQWPQVEYVVSLIDRLRSVQQRYPTCPEYYERFFNILQNAYLLIKGAGVVFPNDKFTGVLTKDEKDQDKLWDFFQEKSITLYNK